MIGVVVSLYLFNGGSHARDTLHVLMGVRIIICNVTHMYLPNKCSSLLLHSRILLIEYASEYSESLYSRIHIRIRHPVFAIRIVFVTWCIRSSSKTNQSIVKELQVTFVCMTIILGPEGPMVTEVSPYYCSSMAVDLP